MGQAAWGIKRPSCDGCHAAGGLAFLHGVVQLGGLEPPTSGSTIRRSNQLSYSCTRLASAMRRAGRTLGTTLLFGKSCLPTGCLPDLGSRCLRASFKRKTRATGPGLIVFTRNECDAVGLDQATFFIALVTPVLIGS